MSTARERLDGNDRLKNELLKEISHWKSSSFECFNGVRESLKRLLTAKSEAQRDIYVARTKLENRLKKLEAKAVSDMRDIIKREEEIIKDLMSKLQNQLRRVDRTQQSIEDISHPTNRVLQDCKDQVNVLKGILRDVKKHEIPTNVEFQLNLDIANIFKGNKTLGETTLKTITGKKTGSTVSRRKKRPQTTRDAERKANVLIGVDRKLEEDKAFKLRQVQSARELREEYMRDKLTASHDSKPHYAQTARQMHKSSESLLDLVTSSIPSDKHQFRNENDLDYNDMKSLREDANRTKAKQAVRYHDYDFVKEITALTDNDDEPYASSKSDSLRHSPQGSTTTISSLYVNSGSSVASGAAMSKPGPSQGIPLKAYFTYRSRFHTKPHPEQTDLCRLTGIAAMDDGKVLVTDVSHLQVMLFGKHLNFLYAIQCNSPYGVCAMSSNMAAITMYHGRKILLVKVHGIYIEKIRGINIDCAQHLYGVTFKADRLFVLCHEGDIHIIELHTKPDGLETLDDEVGNEDERKRLTRRAQEKLFTSPLKKDQKWGSDDLLDASPLYCRDLDGHWKQVKVMTTDIKSGTARHIDVLDDGTKIFVSGNGRVTCFDESGERAWVYTADTNKKMFSPGGIVLFYGRIFVTDWVGSRVLELSLTGTLVREVIRDNLEHPQAMAIQRSKGRIFITQSAMFKQEARSRSVKVFDMK